MDQKRAEDLADEMRDVMVIHGDGRDSALLEEEGIHDADAFIAVTGISETNIMACLLAKAKGVKKTIALVENMDYIHLSQEAGIDAFINKKLLAANTINRYVRHGDVVDVTTLSDVAGAEVLEFKVTSKTKCLGKMIRDMNFPKGATIGGISMSGFTTTGATILNDIEIMPAGLLVWRSITHWIGPYLEIVGEEGTVENLPLEATLVEAEVNGPVVNVEMEQSYRNRGKKTLEAVYVFPTDTDAALYSMEIEINERKIVAEAQEIKKAEARYEEAKKAGKTAAILKRQRPNALEINIANILPKDQIKVRLKYTRVLVPEKDVFKLILPTVSGPKYINPNDNPDDVDWVSQPYVADKNTLSSTYKIQLHLMGPKPIHKWKMDSHKVDIKEMTPSHWLIETQGEDYAGDRDFIAEYAFRSEKVDADLLSYDDGECQYNLGHEPFKDQWALPGGLVMEEERLEEAVLRELKEETGVRLNYLEQLYTFGKPDRDPRNRVVAVCYFGLVKPRAYTLKAATDASDAQWFDLHHLPALAFDHADIVNMALDRLRAKIRYQPIGFDLLGSEFLFSELENLYQSILGQKIDRRNFRKKMTGFGFVEETDKMSKDGPGRPAKLFRFNREKYKAWEEKGFHFEIKFA
ncbi:unnamed protein product [Cyprideis torosa]|uniref:Uncharacterized protein n=1 Tax=Cyprideis torosa TaxID=163714 RepID=A0A7R8ZRA4_9CRUS|nr:unnamed protein product [Cyprideis torosa]CAG0903210.1 unnamed protein product [Cyprideis torosa]